MSDQTKKLKTRPPLYLYSLYKRKSFFLLIIAALLLGQVPLLANLLSWQMSFFHEISHGLAALATGGDLLKIELHFSGAGICYTARGIRWLVLLAGYAGASFWGLLIYRLAGAGSDPGQPSRRQNCEGDPLPSNEEKIKPTPESGKNQGLLPALGLAALLVAVGLLYAQGIQTLIIIMSLAVLYLAAVKFRRHAPLRIFLKLAGMYIMLDALKAPRALLNHQADSDSAKLAALTGLPELIWISLWMATALLCLVMAWKSEGRPEKRLK